MGKDDSISHGDDIKSMEKCCNAYMLFHSFSIKISFILVNTPSVPLEMKRFSFLFVPLKMKRFLK